MSEVIQHQPSLPDVPAPSVATPAQLIELAIRQDAPIERLERLLEMQERYEATMARKAFAAARAALREDLPNITRDGTVAHGNTRYQHATLGGTMRQIRPHLADHGFDVNWRTDVQDKQVIVTCILTHRDGHSEQTSLPGPADTSGSKNAIQAVGSTVTYLQRYTMFALLGLAAGDDDDGRAATPQQQAPAVREFDSKYVQTLKDAAEQGMTALRDAYNAIGTSIAVDEAAAIKAAMPDLKKRAAEVTRDMDEATDGAA